MAQFEAARAESTEILPLDLEAERKETELPSPFDINGVHFALTERACSWRLLPSELSLFLFPYACEPHSVAVLRRRREEALRRRRRFGGAMSAGREGETESEREREEKSAF